MITINLSLIEQQELDKDQADDDAVADQQKKRNLKEKLGKFKPGEEIEENQIWKRQIQKF